MKCRKCKKTRGSNYYNDANKLTIHQIWGIPTCKCKPAPWWVNVLMIPVRAVLLFGFAGLCIIMIPLWCVGLVLYPIITGEMPD